MDLLMNGLLVAATLFAGGYCWVLGRRVQDLKSLDRGLGGSIVTLTRQIELARATLDEARDTSKESRSDLERLVGKADASANQLKMLIAAAPVYPPAPRPEPAPAAAPVAQPLAVVPERPAPRPIALPEMPEPTPEPAPALEPAPVAPAMNLAEVPKPRALAPIENPLRRAKLVARPAASAGERNEDAILEALTALAGGRR